MNESNLKLAKALQSGNSPKLSELGFVRCESETDGFTDIDWTLENDKFRIGIDMYFEVRLYRKNPDSDGIVQFVESISELEEVVYWIADE